MRVPRVGEEFAGYRIEAVLGRGGMGIVFRAEHLGLERKVALKLLAESLSEDDSFRQRFIRESKLAASMDHPNVIPIYGAGEADGLLYIAMRYVDGSDLKEVIKQEGALDPARVLVLLEQVASALDAGHARGLVHRDVKPHNMLIAHSAGLSEDHVYLSDFGLAKQISSKSEITGTGSFMGTIDYVSPEQIEGRVADRRSDVYALGCVLFECLSGSVPFPGDTDMSVAHQHISEAAPALSSIRGRMPRGLDKVIATAMAKSPDDRYQSCEELISAARTVLEASGYELHARVGSGRRPATAVLGGQTEPPVGSPFEPGDPLGSNATQTLGTMGTMAPPRYDPRRTEGEGPGFGQQDPLPPVWQGHPQPPGRRKKRRSPWIVLAVLVIAGLAAGGYFIFSKDDEPIANEAPNFSPRPSSVLPEELPPRVPGFRLIVERLDKVDAEPGFTDKVGALYKNQADQQVFHTVVRYPTVEEAEAERLTELDYFIQRGFKIEEEVDTKQALGGNVGKLTYLRKSDDLDLEAIVWRNDRLAAVVRGPVGAGVDFFNELAY